MSHKGKFATLIFLSIFQGFVLHLVFAGAFYLFYDSEFRRGGVINLWFELSLIMFEF